MAPLKSLCRILCPGFCVYRGVFFPNPDRFGLLGGKKERNHCTKRKGTTCGAWQLWGRRAPPEIPSSGPWTPFSLGLRALIFEAVAIVAVCRAFVSTQKMPQQPEKTTISALIRRFFKNSELQIARASCGYGSGMIV